MKINLFILFLGILVLRVGIAVNYNRGLEREFSKIVEKRYNARQYPTEPYSRGETVRTMDLSAYQMDTRNDGNELGYSEGSIVYVVTLRHPLRYYTQPSLLSEVAVELKAGENYVVKWDGYFEGWAGNTLPTYHRGWRCAVPFLPTQEDSHKDGLARWEIPKIKEVQARAEKLGRYYVRTDDLRRVYEDLIRQLLREEEQASKRQNSMGEDIDLSVHWLYHNWKYLQNQFGEYEHTAIYSVGNEVKAKYDAILHGGFETRLDIIFFENGWYLSPDLKKPLWDTWNTLFLTGAVLCLIAPPVCRKVKRRGEPATD
ncbi:MAG: hypothetical protein ACLRVT_05515 [Oscillospiraceae bacterium]